MAAIKPTTVTDQSVDAAPEEFDLDAPQCRACHVAAMPMPSGRAQYRMWVCQRCGHRIYRILDPWRVIHGGRAGNAR